MITSLSGKTKLLFGLALVLFLTVLLPATASAAGPPDPAHSSVSATDPASPAVGQDFTFTAKVRDAADNTVTGLVYSDFTISGGAGTTTVTGAVYDAGSGDYTVTASHDTAETVSLFEVRADGVYIGDIEDVNVTEFGGAGTLADPYRIANADQLNEVRNHLSAHFILVADIDLSDYGESYDGGKGWVPIGTSVPEAPFTGTFKGASVSGAVYTISGLYINRPGENYQGLFGRVSGATLENVGLEEVDVYAGRYVGGLVGSNNYSDITNSHVTGAVDGDSVVGGLVGYNTDDTITASVFNSETTGQTGGVGVGDGNGVNGMTIAEMKQRDSFTDLGWDFTTPVWQIVEGATYPYLAWQNDNKDFAPPLFAADPQAENITDDKVDVRVQADEDATAYYVVLAGGAAAPSAAQIKAGTNASGQPVAADRKGSIALTAGANGPAAITGLDPETAYDIHVAAEDNADNLQPDALTDMVQVTTFATPDTTAPSVADGTISASGLTETGVTLSWNKAADNESAQAALQYLVYRSDTNDIDTAANAEANGTPAGQYAADIDTKEITGLTDGTTYYFNVIVKDEAGNKTAYTMREVTTSSDDDGGSGGGRGGGGSTAPANHATKFIETDTGGSLGFGSVTVEVPDGTLSADATLKVEQLTEKEAEDLAPSGLLVSLGSDIYEITTTGDRDFGDNFVTVKIAYDPEKIGEGEEPVIRYRDETTGEWVELPTTVEQGEDGNWYAVTQVNHLTKFAVFSTKVEEEAAARVVILTVGQTGATVDGSPYTLDTAPYIDAVANRTLVPIRFVSEALGAQVDWKEETRQVVIRETRNGQQVEIILTIGSDQSLVNGAPVTLDAPAELLPPGRTFVPLRFISETLGARVDWDDAMESITIIR